MSRTIRHPPRHLSTDSGDSSSDESTPTTTSAPVPDSSDTVVMEQQGPITVIGINRPERRNCIDPDTADRLVHALSEFERCPSASVAVLYGVGGTFCSGFDLHWLNQHADVEHAFDLVGGEGRGPMGPTGRPCQKPVIAAVEGHAVAGGLELALWADMRVMESTARVGVLCRRIGVPLLDGGSARLVACVGLTRALDLAMTGRMIDGVEAERIGLASRVVPCGAAFGQAMRSAEEIARLPQQCLLADRRAIYRAAHQSLPLSQVLALERKHGLEALLREGLDGAKKFSEGGRGRHGKFNMEPRWQPPWEQNPPEKQ